MEARRKHQPYYAIRAYQILSKLSDKDIASALGITTRTYYNKVEGFSDFSAEQARILTDLFGRTMDEIFLV